jgi:hypothetical protein
MFNYRTVYAQHYEAKSIIYNTVLGGVSACVGGIINKKKEEKWYKIFVKKFAYGAAGGMLMYSGKKLNTLITNNNNLAFGWLSRGVFSAGVSIIENVSAGDKAWTAWHYDIGFIRFEYNFAEKKFQPKLMPSAFGATLFIAINSKLDLKTSLSSGTLTLRTSQISYQPGLTGSTVTNAILFNDTLTTGRVYYDIYAHEMVHSFQFSEFSGVNHFFKPFTNKWETNSTLYRKVHRWTYGDLNHEMMLLNYFIIQGGSRGNYCRNFLENEAEFLTVGRGACAQ